jgi:hypothetical protein
MGSSLPVYSLTDSEILSFMHQDRYSKDACGMSSSSDGTCPVQANRRFACLRLRLRLPKGRGGGGEG